MNKDFFKSNDFNRLCNYGLAILFGLFLVQNIKIAFHSDFKLSIILLVSFNALIVYLLLTRHKPKDVSFELQDIVATFLGTFAMMLSRGVADSPDILPLQIVGLIGFSVSIVGLATLKKSFGLLPADRGVVSHGIYKYIRHPIYSGYLVHYTCFLAQNYSINNAVLFVIFVFFECYRLVREEKLLKKNPEYLAYMQTTKWRIFPKIW
jgi:protein-S-isoprenylcysteine O-methyltransferase Ste14